MEPGRVPGQRLPERGQAEDARFGLGEHPGAGQRAQQPAQRRRARPGLPGQHLDRDRPGRQVVRDAEHGGRVQRLGDLEPGQELDHLDGGRYIASMTLFSLE